MIITKRRWTVTMSTRGLKSSWTAHNSHTSHFTLTHTEVLIEAQKTSLQSQFFVDLTSLLLVSVNSYGSALSRAAGSVCACSLELSISIDWAGNNDIRERGKERKRVGGGKARVRVREKCCIPAGSLGTNGNRFIKPHPALFCSFSLGTWLLKHSCRIPDTWLMSVY